MEIPPTNKQKIPTLWLNWVLLSLFTISLLVSFFLPALSKLIFSPHSALDAIHAQDVNLNAPQWIADLLLAGPVIIQDPSISANVTHLNRDQLRSVVFAMIPPNWAGNQVDHLVSSFYLLWSSKNPPGEISVDISDVKVQFTQPGNFSYIEGILAHLPGCLPGQVTALLDPGLAGQGDIPMFCKPDPVQMVGVVMNLQTALPKILSHYPDQIVVWSKSPGSSPNLKDSNFISSLQITQKISLLAPILCGILFGGVCLVNRNRFGQGLRTLGKLIFGTSSIVLIGAITILISINALVNPEILSTRFTISLELSKDIFPVVVMLGDTFLFYLALMAFAGVLLGTIVILIARSLQNQSRSLT